MLRTMINGMAIAAVLGLGGVALATKADAEKAHEHATALSAKVSAVNAIAAAEHATGGGAVKLDIEDNNGTFLFEIRTVTQDRIADAFIDPATGKVVRAKDEGLIARVFEREDREAVAKLHGFPTTLATAVATAEQQTGGKTFEAAYGDEDDKAVFEVKIAKDGATQKVEIDAASGKVTKVSAEKRANVETQ